MKKKTRKQAVLDHLTAAGTWVDGHHLCEPWSGGTSGLRRVRELRADGHVIEKRRKPGSDEFQYRLVPDSDRTSDPSPAVKQRVIHVR